MVKGDGVLEVRQRLQHTLPELGVVPREGAGQLHEESKCLLWIFRSAIRATSYRLSCHVVQGLFRPSEPVVGVNVVRCRVAEALVGQPREDGVRRHPLRHRPRFSRVCRLWRDGEHQGCMIVELCSRLRGGEHRSRVEELRLEERRSRYVEVVDGGGRSFDSTLSRLARLLTGRGRRCHWCEGAQEIRPAASFAFSGVHVEVFSCRDEDWRVVVLGEVEIATDDRQRLRAGERAALA